MSFDTDPREEIDAEMWAAFAAKDRRIAALEAELAICRKSVITECVAACDELRHSPDLAFKWAVDACIAAIQSLTGETMTNQTEQMSRDIAHKLFEEHFGGRAAFENCENISEFARALLAAHSAPAPSVLKDIIGCFNAAEVEGLTAALRETTDLHLKDLVERRLMYALAYAQEGLNSAPVSAQDAPTEWIESEECMRGMPLHNVLNSNCVTVIWHSKKPTTSNPVWEVAQQEKPE